jgi:hypothetical protein
MNATSPTVRARLQVEALEQRCLPTSSSYVSSLYTHLLQRPGSAPEVGGWVAQLDAGLPPAQVTDAFVTSPEFRSDVIEHDYHVLLQRTPQPAEVQGWLHQLENGLSEPQMEAAFLSSAEFVAHHGNDNVSWLKAVYPSVLGRPAGAADLAAWTGPLQNGLALQKAALDIVMSPEASARQVNAAYEHLLDRIPDTTGLAFWSGQLEQGLSPAQLAAQIAASAEYINRHGGLDALPMPPSDTSPPTGDVYPGPGNPCPPTGVVNPIPSSNPNLGNTGDTGTDPGTTGDTGSDSSDTGSDPCNTCDTGSDPGNTDDSSDPGYGY